ncbi:helix-turn-helix domain-containing protein [Streptomyces sp. NPDC015032]|uniref:helix-turn-helix domain-containing protein n=1 Tax=Streptomyces sp. NPDC015032 TaxID=3364937 RepID=UPI0036F7AAC4
MGVRLRELRTTCPGGRLTGSELTACLGWTQPKTSKLENGRRTATLEDLGLWPVATGHPVTYDELQSATMAGTVRVAPSVAAARGRSTERAER